MAGERDDPGRDEDAFDDLDAYFAKGQGEGEGLEDDLLPPGWAPDVRELDIPDESPHAATPTDPPSPAGEGGRRDEPEPTQRRSADDITWGPDAEDAEAADSDVAEDDTTVWRGEPTEMEGEDWRRIRDVLGEDEEEAGLTGEVTPVTPEELVEEQGVGEEEGSAEGPEGPDWLPPGDTDLTLEDLKKAPREYQDLPGVEETASGPQPPDMGDEVEEVPEEDVGELVATELPSEPSWEEPDIAQVEAAADQLAYEFREAGESDEVERELLSDLDRPGPRTVKVGPEGMTGPAWEEPTSRVVMAEPSSPMTAGRDLPAALLTAGVLAVAALISLAIDKRAFAVVAGLVVLLGQAELYGTMNKRGHQPATALGLVVGGLILAGAYLKGEQAMLFFVALGLLLSFLWYMAAAPKSREGAIGNIGTTMLGIIYVPFLAGYMLIILSQVNSGRATMVAILGLTFLYDVAAFVIGSFWGARALAPTISPKKSWEGLFGATVITVTVAVAALPSLDPIGSVGKAVGLALVIVLFAPLGDLAESAIKRDLGVKDMGSILPGHGGILDRIDSVLFVAPAAFYFLRLAFG